ncbi:MAG TPA: pirin family protein [Lentimicrobium sp.]|nr:pirin family protein [Lentimicrobium sp.]
MPFSLVYLPTCFWYYKYNLQLKLNIHKNNERGFHDYGWLKTRHSFSFGDYFNPLREDFGVVRVLNDETYDIDSYLGMHYQKNLEVILIPLKGKLSYNTANDYSVKLNHDEILITSTGSGIKHSFGNQSKESTLELLQIWVYSKIKDTEPRSQVLLFPASERKNQLQVIAEPDIISDVLWINQNAWIFRIDLTAGNTFEYTLKDEKNLLMVFIVEGSLRTNASGEIAQKRDSFEMSETGGKVALEAMEDSEILIIESVPD